MSKLMERLSNERGLICEAYMWTHEGGPLRSDEQHAFRYRVIADGEVIGYITADRARSHPGVMWRRSLLQSGRAEELTPRYRTIEEALVAF